jgi:hypothetical protein
VHHQSHRARRAIICVSSLAVAPGPSAAAETGVRVDILDKLRLAQGGTLYLDGIQHLPADAQRALAARVREIDERRRAGGVPDLDVRIIASTTRDVDEELRRPGRRSGTGAPSTLDSRARQRPRRRAGGDMLRRQAELPAGPCRSSGGPDRAAEARLRPGNVELRTLGAAPRQPDPTYIGDQLPTTRSASCYTLSAHRSGGMGDVWLRATSCRTAGGRRLVYPPTGDGGRELSSGSRGKRRRPPSSSRPTRCSSSISA